MNKYQVTANCIDFGIFEADTAEQALDLYAQSAGYTSYSYVVEVWGEDATAVEVAA